MFAELLWTAPEILRGKLKTAGSPSADVYSLAIIFTEIVTTRKPFYDRDSVEGDTI